MLAALQRRSAPGIPIAQAMAKPGTHPLEQQLNARGSVRRLQGQAAQLNARGLAGAGAALKQARVAEPVVQGLWPELGLAALGAAAAYKWWNGGGTADKKKAQSQKQREALAKAIHAKRRKETVASLLEETEGIARRRDVKVTANTTEASGATGADEGGYTANVNPEHPISPIATKLLGKDPHLLHTARMHELTHIAAWEGYGGSNRKEAYPFNMAEKSKAENQRIAKRVAHLEAVRKDDPYLQTRDQKEQEFLKKRVEYMETYPAYEFDSVLNELVYYMHLKKIPPESPFSKALVAEARTQQEHRQAKGRKRK